MLQARLNRSFSRLSSWGYLASFSCMVGKGPQFSGIMDLLLGEGSLTHLHLLAAAFLHKWFDLHLIAPPWGGVQVEVDRKRLVSGLPFSPSPLLPLLGDTTLLGQLMLHSLPG